MRNSVGPEPPVGQSLPEDRGLPVDQSLPVGRGLAQGGPDAPVSREILLIRHGRTPGNELHRYNGRTDEPLSDAGRAALAEKRFDLAAFGAFAPAFADPSAGWPGESTSPPPKLDASPRESAPIVYVTPLRRTQETAAILFPGARQLSVPGLREMDFGDFEGRFYADMEHDAAYRAWVDSGCLGPIPNGEGRAAFVPRCCAAFRAVLAADKSPRLVFVVHGGSIMALCSEYAAPKKDYFDWQPPNGGGYLLRTAGDGPEMELVAEL